MYCTLWAISKEKLENSVFVMVRLTQNEHYQIDGKNHQVTLGNTTSKQEFDKNALLIHANTVTIFLHLLWCFFDGLL